MTATTAMPQRVARLALLALALCTLAACSESFEERCRREAREFTLKQCPRRLDECTTLDSMVFTDSPCGFKYCYRASGQLDNDSVYADQESLDEFRDNLVQSIRADIGLRQCKDRGFTFTYIYSSASTGRLLMQHVITPDDYR
ncbi:MAG: hypothetical protein IJS59_09085 [Bacteroidaceae bacterium]|nr:hypothetical protein [Bacteroidaceae bacterium]